MALRLVFMGTPDFALPTLRALVAAGHEVVAVYTRAPKPAGRGMNEQVTPVERVAREFGLPVFSPTSLKGDDAERDFRAHQADAAVVVAYGLILPQTILDTPRLGCFNLHASLLPRWRGAAPINRAIMAGDRESGAMVMKMDAGLDTGDVASTFRVSIVDATTAGDLHDTLSESGGVLMADTIRHLEEGTMTLTPQSADGITYAAKIDKEEARIDWTKPAQEVLRHCHGLSPFPGAWTEAAIDGKPVRLKILRCTVADVRGSKSLDAPGELIDDNLMIACGDGAIRATQLQRAGKQPMIAGDFLRGTRLQPGTRMT